MNGHFSARKTCSGCGESLPIEAFRRRRKGSDKREARCGRCHAAAMRKYRRSQREARIDQFAAAVKWRTDTYAISRLCEAMLRRFGGPEAFASEWREHIRRAPGSKQAIDGLMALLRLIEIEAREEARQERWDNSLMSKALSRASFHTSPATRTSTE